MDERDLLLLAAVLIRRFGGEVRISSEEEEWLHRELLTMEPDVVGMYDEFKMETVARLKMRPRESDAPILG